MNSKLSTIINGILIIAVAVLYYLHFSSPGVKTTVALSAADSAKAASKPIVMAPKEIKGSKIVYVNIDELNQKYDYIKDVTAAAQTKQRQLENAYQAKAQKLQEDYTSLQEKASQGLLSENQSKAAQEDLGKRKGELEQMQEQVQVNGEELQKKTEDIRKTIVDYLTEYNKTSRYNYVMTYTKQPGGILLLANDSLNITNEIIEGLNAQYKSKKGKK